MERLQGLCDALGAEHIDALLRKWLKILPHPFTAHDEAAGYRYELSILQAEFSLTQVLDRPVSGRIFFEQVIRDNLDIGRPDQVGLVFDRRIIRMVDAWRYAHRSRNQPIRLRHVLALGRAVEPYKNQGGLRRVGVRVGRDVKMDSSLVPPSTV